MPNVRGSLPFILIALLASCANEPMIPPPCPDVGIINGADRTEAYRGTSRNASDLVYRASLTGIGGGCIYDEGGVTLEYSVQINVEGGPATEDTDAPIRYFVVVENNLGGLESSRTFETVVEDINPGSITVANEQLQQRINESNWSEALGHRVLIGFDIDLTSARDAWRRTQPD